MPRPDQPATRDKERTRRAIVQAGAVMIAEHGGGVSLAEIAAHAGVSKGALMHHFASRGALEEAILAEWAERFRDEVHAHVDRSEDRPGRLLRGYIRALTSNGSVVRETFSPTFLGVILGAGQAAHEILRRDAESWRAAFAADGIDAATVLVLRSSAEGLAAGIGSPYLTTEELVAARERLLELADPGTGAASD